MFGLGGKKEEEKKEEGKDGEKKEEEKKEGGEDEEEDPEKMVEKPKLKLPLSEKFEKEKLRRWQVKIWNIKIISTINENFDPFLQFSMGGNYCNIIKYNKDGLAAKEEIGDRKLIYRTDVIFDVPPNQIKSFRKAYSGEIDLSYLEIEDSHFDLELWDYAPWGNNEFKAHIKIPLKEVANGEISRTIEISKPEADRITAKIMFNILFQEIWDFNLTFIDWKGTDVKTKLGFLINPALKFDLYVNGSLEQKITTEEKELEAFPHWGFISETMQFRGTIADLESQYLKISLLNVEIIFKMKESIGNNFVSLKGVAEHGTIRTEIIPKKSKKDKQELKKRDVKRPDSMGKGKNKKSKISIKKKKTSKSEGEEKRNSQFQEEENEQKKIEIEVFKLLENGVVTKYLGKIDVGKKPKYSQYGDFDAIKSNQIYLCVAVKRVEKLTAPIDRDSYNCFVEVEWGGLIKKTRTLYETLQPNFNEILYYQIPITETIRRNNNKLKKFLINELSSKFVIKIDLWADNNGINENLGSAEFFLAELSSLSQSELSYYYDEEDMNFNYKSRQFNGKRKLVSSYRLVEKIWFMPEIPLNNELKEFPTKIYDDLPADFNELENHPEHSDLYYEWCNKIDENFAEVTGEDIVKRKEIMKNFVFMLDQYKKKHFVSLFLSKISPPQFVNSINQINDKDTNKKNTDKKNIKSEISSKNQHLNSVQTMGEIAHFVRCIPYYKNPLTDIWSTPDFFLTAKKGDSEEHSLLLASLFMGCATENIQDLEKKREDEKNKKKGKKNKLNDEEKILKKFESWDPKALENRTFVCIGTLKKSLSYHTWVMIYNRDFSEITFWECRNGRTYTLKGRVLQSERDKLRNLLCPSYLNYEERLNEAMKKKIKGLSKLRQKLGNKLKNMKNNITNAKNKATNMLKKNEVVEENGENVIRDEEIMEREAQAKARKKKYLDLDDDNELNDDEEEENIFKRKQEKTIGLEELGQVYRNIHIKDVGNEGALDPRTRAMLRKVDDVNLQNNNNDENDFFSKEALMGRQKEKESQSKVKHLKPVEEFHDDEGNIIFGEEADLPYRSIEAVINNKNVWVNLRNFNPAKIHYHLHNPDEWLPFLHTNKNGEFKIWNQGLENFYRTKNMISAIGEHAIEELQNSILKEVKIGIVLQRTSLNLATKFRPNNDKIVTELGTILTAYENLATHRISKEIFDKINDEWKAKMTKFIPTGFTFKAVPMFFNESNPEKIRNIITENSPSFILEIDTNTFQNKQKKWKKKQIEKEKKVKEKNENENEGEGEGEEGENIVEDEINENENNNEKENTKKPKNEEEQNLISETNIQSDMD